MSDDWRRDPNIIEGEYEVIGESYEAYGPQGANGISIDKKPPYVTYVFLALNIGTWLIMSLVGLLMGWNQSQQLFYFGAKVNLLIVQGEYWRLLTAMFLHIGILHLFFNSYALYIYGPLVEKLFGKVKFTLIYLISGLIGSLLSYIFSAHDAAGASGAIFGLMGSLLYFRKEKKSLYQKVFGPGLILIIGINLVYGFVQPGIDNWGHIGGLLGGFLMGNALGLYGQKDKKQIRRILIWLLIAIIFLAGLGYGQIKHGAIIHLRKAYDSVKVGNYAGARAHISRLSTRARNKPDTKEFIGALFVEDINNSIMKEEPEKALESINLLLDYYPKEMDYYFYRGNIYESMGDYENALLDYLYVTKTIKNSDKVWFGAGRAAYNSGKVKDAKEYLKEALKINPSHGDAKKLLEEISNMI